MNLTTTLHKHICMCTSRHDPLKTAKEETIKTINIAASHVADTAPAMDLVNVLFDIITKVNNFAHRYCKRYVENGSASVILMNIMSTKEDSLRKANFETDSGISVERIYHPTGEFPEDPGQYPFTRGVHGEMYRASLLGPLPLYAGFYQPLKASNERYHYLLKNKTYRIIRSLRFTNANWL